MSDRPDWLPVPPPETKSPMGKRVGLAVASVVSLLLGVFGSLLLLGAVLKIVDFKILDAESASGILLGTLLLGASYSLRRYLHRERQELRKRVVLPAARNKPN